MRRLDTLAVSEDRTEAWSIAHKLAAQLSSEGHKHLSVGVVQKQGTYQVELYSKEKS